MRVFFAGISLLFSTICISQVTTTIQRVIVDSGKYEFKLQAKSDTPNYSKAYQILTNQVKINPKNAELRYFLGYTIDRLNVDDGRGMIQLKKEMTIRASEQFEEVNRLEPIYKGELFILDPYAKLSSIWGSLAAAYLSQKLIDSAKLAFSEGKKRGGFNEPILEFNRQLLNSCDKNAVLITYGDNTTFPVWYLQTVENYRSDITAVDANLINTVWYPKYLKAEKNLKLSFSDAVIDTIEYTQWKAQIVSAVNPGDTTQKFNWELRPTYLDEYILKGDRILLDIIQQNFYTRPVYFVSNSDSSYNLFLSSYLADEGLVNRLKDRAFNFSGDTVVVSRNLYNYSIAKIKSADIAKSRDAVIVLNNFRWAFLNNISNLANQANYAEARELIKHMTSKFPKEKLPFESEETEKYFKDFFQQVEKYYQ